MPRTASIQTAFVAGELSPRMRARVDLERYNKGLSVLENGIVQVHGPVEKRRGFKFVAEVYDSSKPHRLIPFVFSDEQAYVLEFGHQTLRFYKDGGLIMSGPTPYEISTPYLSTDLARIKYAQSADVIWLVHPNYPIYQLSRYGHTDWRLSEFAVEGGPWLPDNRTETTLQNSGTIGRITLTATPEDGEELVTNGYFTAAFSPEHLTNGNFNIYPDSAWTWGPNWTHDPSTLTAVHSTGSTAQLSQSITVMSGYVYQVIVVVSGRTAGSITLSVGGASGSAITSNGTTTQYLIATTTDGLTVAPTTDFDGALLLVSVQQLVSAPDWTFNAGWSHDLIGLAAVHASGGGTAPLEQVVSVTAGKFYKLSFAVSSRTAGSVTPMLGTTTGLAVTSNVVSTQIIQAPSGNALLKFVPTNDFDGKIDNISLREYGQNVDIFTSDHVGALFNLKHETGKTITSVVNGNPTKITSANHGLKDGDLVILHDMSPGATWSQLSGLDFAITKIDNNTFSIPYDTAGFTGFLSGSWTRKHGGVCKIVQVIDGRTAFADVVVPFTSTKTTRRWAESAWSKVRGYPRAVTLYEGRLWFAGTAYQPQTVWASVVDDYGNFQIGPNDNDALSLTISSDQLDVIEWLWASRVLVAGTRAGIWRFMGANLSEPLTPTSVTLRREIAQGTSYISPVSTSIASLALDERNKRLLEIAYNFEIDSYVANDMSIMSSHTLSSGATALSLQNDPDPILWLVNNDGELVGCTYSRSQEVVAWHRHVTNGSVESIAVIPGANGDQVWAVINRAGGRYVEYLDPANENLDSYLIYSGPATKTMIGLDHLEGETVTAYYNNGYETKTVSGGQITLTTATTWAAIGLTYRLTMRTLPIEAGAQEGTAQGKIKRLHGLTLMLGDTAHLQVGTPDWQHYLTPVKALSRGDFFIHLPDRYTQVGQVELRQEAPYPTVVLGMVFRLITTDQ